MSKKNSDKINPAKFSRMIEDNLQAAMNAFIAKHTLSCGAQVPKDYDRFAEPKDLTTEYMKCLKCDTITEIIRIDYQPNGDVKIKRLQYGQ